MTDVSLADPDVGPAAYDRIEALLERGALADGPEVRRFEDAFADYCETDHAVATSNGTTALQAALEALGVDDGDAVVTSPFSFVASANAIRLAGGRPVFADVDPDTFVIDPDSVERRCRERDDVVGLLPVHLYGLPAPMDELTPIADEHDCFVLEDACQAHGATIDGRPAGSIGDAGCFSFYPTKNMTTGEGGMVTTSDAALAARVQSYVNHGRRDGDDRGYEHAELGSNHRMTSIAAAIGRRQLDRLPELTRARREHAEYYDEHLADLPVRPPAVPNGRTHVYHQYTVRADDRDALRESLDDAGVETGVYYPTPIHRLPAYDSVHTAATTLPKAERAAREVLSIPVHPGLDADDCRRVVRAIATHYESA
ncbi:DegT/DnrJ/EryC1/StrS family aminotransferase [Halovivax limisalsi]|uniref:DegT/DnrJ/EryC1/StrS family aminotransferase n=1 Tax=Halovivax limisalsi TaxID=1453760 RepID=UPI001FFCCCA8|nr:DegT/DnrJ/EryC1/StrS family aminotransferase [Halovivax limisalsi]